MQGNLVLLYLPLMTLTSLSYSGLIAPVTCSLVLVPTGSVEIAVNSSLQMTCSYGGLVSADEFFQISWNVVQNGIARPLGIVRKNCDTFGALAGDDYNVTCPDTDTQTITINRINIELQEVNVRCELAFSVSNKSVSNYLTILVTVPVSEVNMKDITTSDVTVTEGIPAQFTCQTSASRPNATVYWYKEGTDDNADIIAGGVTTTFIKANDSLVITQCYLNYTFNRADKGSWIYCTANNTNNQNVRSPQRPRMNVLYQPDDSPMIEGYNNGNTVLMIENSTLSLLCVITGGNPRPVLTWNCDGGIQTAGSSGNTVTANITVKRRRDQDGPCKCSASHVLWSSSTQMVEVVIDVLYPPTKPTIEINGESRNGSVKVMNNTEVPLTCISSGKPAPDFSWTYQGIPMTGSSVNVMVDGNSTATCTASNTLVANGDALNKSSSINIHILYGPHVPELFCYSKNAYIPIDASIDVIESNNVNLSCNSDGDPTSVYSWNGTTGNTIAITNVQKDLVYTCIAMNEPKPDYGNSSQMYASNHVMINMMYGPRREPTLTYRYNATVTTTISTHLNVTENSTFHLICSNSDSRPPPAYRWIGDTTSSNGNLLVTEIKRLGQQDVTGASFTEITCVVENEMMNSCGDRNTFRGEMKHTVKVFILYPVTIEAPKNISVLEGRNVVLTAHVISHGSPRETYSWTYNNIHIADNLIHILKNVSRHDAGHYTIEATNHIAATGFQPYQETVKTRTYINVFYTTTISSFTVDGGRGDITVNENDTVRLECTVDSNPLSNVFINASTYDGTKILAETQSQNTILHTIQTTTCWDAGSYRCYGYNSYTQNHAFSNVTRLRVNCTPRPRFFTDQNVTFYEALGGRIELNLTVIAHPEPNEESYRWWKLNNGDWFDVVNDTNINITTTGLDSRLTIAVLQESNFGQYRLTIDYHGGTYNHLFFIAPKDKPQTPTQFTHRQDFVTQSSAVLTWKPGFNGGSAQTFHILYKKQNDPDWKEIIVTSEGTNVTITGLSPGTIYLVKMYAHNSQGNSSETTTITVTTLEDGSVEHGNIPLVAGTVGGAGSAVILICVTVAIVIYMRRHRNSDNHKGHLGNKTEITYYNTVQLEARNETNTDTDRSVYEGLGSVTENEHAYGTLTENGAAETSVRAIVYENVPKALQNNRATQS